MSLIAELKRRNVIRMAGLYVVGAYLRTVREGAAIRLASVDLQKQLALKLLNDINQYPGKNEVDKP